MEWEFTELEERIEADGKFVRWDTPPPINEGTDKSPRIINHHAGDIWNCRCYPEPEIPEG